MRLRTFFFATFVILLMIINLSYASDTDKYWKQVDASLSKRLPRTAIENLNEILKITKRKKLYNEWLTALTKKIVIEASIESNKPEQRISKLKPEIDKADQNLKPVLKLILAKWYWIYFEKDRYRLLNRTITEGLDDKGFTTWDGQRILKEIDSIYCDVMKEKKWSANIPTSSLIGFLEEGSMPLELTPTLYDFALREALSFYQKAKSYVVKAEDKLEVDANSGAFAEAEEFIRYNPTTDDTLSFDFKVIRLFQELIRYYKENGYYEAYLDIDIQRLNYIKNICYGEDKNEVYIKRLTEFIERNRNYSITNFGAYHLAKAMAEKGDKKKAYEIAKQAYELHPNSLGATYCYSYMIELTQQSLKLLSESYVPSDTFVIKLYYKNISKIYFRVYRDRWDEFLYDSVKEPLSIGYQKEKQLLAGKPDVEWAWDAPEIDSLNERIANIRVPKLQPGFYRIFASLQPDFNVHNVIENINLWVCNFTVTFSKYDQAISGYVLDAVSGEPIKGAIVKTIIKKGYYDSYKFIDSAKTDSDGYFRLNVSSTSFYSFYLLVKYGNEELLSHDVRGVYSSAELYRKNSMIVMYFTDRSIYRPGQTIYFKGICVNIDEVNNTYSVVPDKEIKIVFKDVNEQEIASQLLVTNEFGSISGHFIAPTDRITGRMCIESKEPNGEISFRVEEYKRPKFFVRFEKPKGEYKLNSDIEIVGQAVSYTGAPVSDAEVRFTVECDVSYPSWLYRFFSRYRNTQKIKHGKIKTDSAGYFKIVFFAKPDPKISPEKEPVFTFKVTADVISADGETRSAYEYIKTGYSPIKADLSKTDEMLFSNRNFGLVFSTFSLADEKIPANVKIEIYKLKEPIKPVRKKLKKRDYWNYDYEVIEDSVGEFGENWIEWPEDRIVYIKNTNTKIGNPDTLFLKLPVGLYKAVCKAYDSYGRETKAILPLMIWPEKESRRFSIKLPFVAEVKKTELKVGERLEAFWGTGYNNGRCHITIEQLGKVLKKFWTPAGTTMHSFIFPVTESLRGGFVVNFIYVRENRMYQESIPIIVPWTNKELDVIVEHFRDKLLPGEKETITLKVKGKEKPINDAEVVATMYDYSLDQYYRNEWYTNYFFKYGAWNYRKCEHLNVAVTINFGGLGVSIKCPEIDLVHFPYYIDKCIRGFSSAEVIIIDEDKTEASTSKYSKLKGKVLDAITGEALEGAGLILVNNALFSRTNCEGEYIFNNIWPGTYTIHVSYIGYQHINKIVECKSGKTTIVNFKLAPTTIVSKELAVARTVVEPAGKVLKGGSAIDNRPDDLITIRKNFNETAFFYPHLLMDKEGTVKLEFTMPEALTKWKFMAYAHGKECESGVVTAYTVTRKDLMVQPNVPRFLRENDTIYFTAKVVNMVDMEQNGFVRLDFSDAITEKSVNENLKLGNSVQEFKISPNSSETFYWKIILPKGTGPLSYTIVAKSGNFSDGETGVIPVLSSRIFLTESMPLSIVGSKNKTFVFKEIESFKKSKTKEPFKLTVQVTSNPVWYAIQALPYLIEFPYENNEQIFNRYYANSLSTYIARSSPKIKKVFDQWIQTGAVRPNIEKNQDLKSVTLMETPWVREAQGENQTKQNISILFQENTLRDNINSAFYRLKNNQNPDGGWSWFPGGKSSPYITMYIIAGFGRLKHIGVDVDLGLVPKAFGYLDDRLKKEYIVLKRCAHEATMYLYCRSFFMEQYPPGPEIKKLIDTLITKAELRWQTINSRISQGYLALALHRFGRTETAIKILRSIKERSIIDDEKGMYWRDLENYWYWYRAPIETQAVMIEAFTEIMGDLEAVEACKTWLIQQKHTQNWRTTKATADAIYALILRVKDYIFNDAIAEIKLGSNELRPDNIEAGTGYYEKAFFGREIKSDFANITFSKKEDGVAWASVYLQYFDEMSDVKKYSTGLSLQKRLFVKRGTVIEPLNGPVNVGDIITVRIILRASQDMEFLHLKDMRGSGLEPVNVLSCYRYQDRLWYYQSTKDVATHFFIDYLPKGTYVFEYDLRVQLKGKYQSGIAEVQCMYAPEFNSHSESYTIEVR